MKTMVRIPELAYFDRLETGDDGPRSDGVQPAPDAEKAEGLCSVLVASVHDAALSLILLERAQRAERDVNPTVAVPLDELDPSNPGEAIRKVWGPTVASRYEAVTRRLEEALSDKSDSGGQVPVNDLGDVADEALREFERAKWAAGELPEQFTRRIPTLHARQFILALAQLDRAIAQLGRLDLGDRAINEAIRRARDQFKAEVPIARRMRNSIEHAEQRAVGERQRGQPIAPVSGGGYVFALDNLAWQDGGGVYIGTLDDGTIEEVDINATVVEHARCAAQRVLDALPWALGARQRIEPSK